MSQGCVFAGGQAVILREQGHTVKDVAKILNETERWVKKCTQRSRLMESLQDRLRTGRLKQLSLQQEQLFVNMLRNCTSNSIKKAKRILKSDQNIEVSCGTIYNAAKKVKASCCS